MNEGWSDLQTEALLASLFYRALTVALFAVALARQRRFPFLTKSMASYARAASGSDFVEYRMIKLKQQAETETLLAAALLRIGRKD